MTRKTITTPVDNHDLWLLVLCNVRYAMGRESTAPYAACEFVRRWALRFTPGERQHLTDEIRRELVSRILAGTIGRQCDREVWTETLHWLEAHG